MKPTQPKHTHRLHHSINSMGCTGGGAYKFSDLFQERLGITLRKMDELDCLMRGLEFVLQHVVGECYTFKPDKSLSMPPPGAGGGSGGMPWRPASSSPPAAAATPNVFASGPPSDIPPLPKGKVSRMGGMSTSASSPTVHAAADSSTSSTSSRSPPTAFSHDDDGLGLSLDGTEGFAGDGDETPDTSPRLRTTSAASASSSIPSPGEPRRPPGHTGGANAGTLKQEWKYKVQRSGEHVIYPYLVVNIGSGVSILKVEGPGKYERISGSSLGGGTYWGLCRLLTGCKTFDEVLDLAEIGDANVVDMSVGDIYGRGYDKFHLSSSVIASSFGKLATRQDPGEGIREEDMARALLMMITGNIGQVAYLNAVIHRATHIYFVGNFLRHNKISCRRLAYAIDYWSGGKMEALFLEHEGYFGSLGAFLNSSYVEELHAHNQEASGMAQTVGPGAGTEGGTKGTASGTGGTGKASRAAAKLRRMQSSPQPSEPGMSGGGGRRIESLRLEASYGGFIDPVLDEEALAPSPTAGSVGSGGGDTPPPAVVVANV